MNKASIQRHERYCRSKLAHPPPPRQKSCVACIKAKARCDSRKPECGPCQIKGRKCTYSGESLVSRVRESNGQYDSSRNQSSLSDTPETLPIAMPQSISWPIPSRLLRRKKQQPVNMAHISELVSRIICSFPGRMIKETSYPPFIHQSTFEGRMGGRRPDDPIVICQSICRKLSGYRDEGDFSVWDAVASEQERMYDQRASFDKWIFLSSAQAITIYLLMLAAEGENALIHHPTLPLTLLFTLGTHFTHLHQINPGYTSAKERNKTRLSWEDWIFAESKLRMAIVYFILELHFDLNFGLPCNREGDVQFEDLELPGTKALWEAKDQLSWQKEYDLIAEDRYFETRLKYSDLRSSYTQDSDCGQPHVPQASSELAKRIEIWQREMDEFGILVAMCSTIM
ncbi:hypothetical protein B7463_g11862, partial [Scytalidium lignicola]